MKLLFWDGSGLVMAYKRLEENSFTWPTIQDGAMTLNRAHFEVLYARLDWRRARSEKLNEDEWQLADEDLETAVARSRPSSTSRLRCKRPRAGWSGVTLAICSRICPGSRR